jgi:hypothetical protein
MRTVSFKNNRLPQDLQQPVINPLLKALFTAVRRKCGPFF